MSRRMTDMFVCDRCEATESPRSRRSEDDDGFPLAWARTTFRDSQVSWEHDLCRQCADRVRRVLRGGS